MNYIFTHYSGNMDLVNSGLVMFFNVYDDVYRIFYKNKFQFHTNEEPDMVFTMACVDGDTYKMIDNKMFCHNKFPSIIHQYNRKEDATKWLKNIFM